MLTDLGDAKTGALAFTRVFFRHSREALITAMVPSQVQYFLGHYAEIFVLITAERFLLNHFVKRDDVAALRYFSDASIHTCTKCCNM